MPIALRVESGKPKTGRRAFASILVLFLILFLDFVFLLKNCPDSSAGESEQNLSGRLELGSSKVNSGALENTLGSSKANEAKQTSHHAYQVFKISDENEAPLAVCDLLQIDRDIYLLAIDSLYKLPDLAGSTQEEKALKASRIAVPNQKVKNVPIQEFLAFTYWPKHKSLAVLDKSGSIFEYQPLTKSWDLVFANKRTLGSPDPHYVSMTSDGQNLLLLDPERNQIWRFPQAAKSNRYFKDVMPWRIRAGDPNVSDGVAIGFEPGSGTFVLRSSGQISIYSATASGGNGNPKRLNWKAPPNLAPTRMALSYHSPCFVVDRENSRVIAIDKKKGAHKQYLFPAASDLRGVLPGYGGFCVIDGSSLAFRMLAENDAQKNPTPRVLDKRLQQLQIPIKGGSLPRHPGVFPGARRLYRHGIHQGLDFFDDPGGGTRVSTNTPAVAAACGKVIRADINYQDMDAKQYGKIMRDCAQAQYCSDANEDLFRGCQVWLDHGNGLVTRYAHLNKARPDLKIGMQLNAGETLGYIGYSGTGENHPSSPKHPHLHFEIWLDGHYLGYGLSPPEIISVYRKIFNKTKTKGH